MPLVRCNHCDHCKEVDSVPRGAACPEAANFVDCRFMRARLQHAQVVDDDYRAIPDPNVKHIPADSSPDFIAGVKSGQDEIAELRERLAALENAQKAEKKTDLPPSAPGSKYVPQAQAPAPVPVEA